MDWSYVAGFTDGDGCITFEKRGKKSGTYYSSRIRWAQKESTGRVLDEIAQFLRTEGLSVSGRNFSVARAGHKYPQRELAITRSADTRIALHNMLPYLVVKKERAEQVLAHLDLVHNYKQALGNKYEFWMRQAAVAA